jgi:hypothetical protein
MGKGLLLFVLLFSVGVQAAVWKTTNSWSNAWENRYQEWVKSDDFTKDFFSNRKSRYYGLRTDCADIIYALRIIFSAENGLPFKIKNPSGHRWYEDKFLTNESKAFDKHKAGPERVRKFIQYLTATHGTEYLARQASYPVKIEAIGPGDMYMYKSDYNHAYIIKNRDIFGNLRMWFSTTPKMVRTLQELNGVPAHGFQKAPWGYKRFKWPRYIGKPTSAIPTSLQISNEIYEVAQKAGLEDSLEGIKGRMQKVREPLEVELNREIENICNRLSDRRTIIEVTKPFIKRIRNRCVTQNEYNSYSTPSRDYNIYTGIYILELIWNTAIEDEEDHLVKDKSLVQFLRTLTKKDAAGKVLVDDSPEEVANLNKFCTMNFKGHPFTLNIKDYYSKYERGEISSHPNATFLARWGQEKDTTKCKEY